MIAFLGIIIYEFSSYKINYVEEFLHLEEG